MICSNISVRKQIIRRGYVSSRFRTFCERLCTLLVVIEADGLACIYPPLTVIKLYSVGAETSEEYWSDHQVINRNSYPQVDRSLRASQIPRAMVIYSGLTVPRGHRNHRRNRRRSCHEDLSSTRTSVGVPAKGIPLEMAACKLLSDELASTTKVLLLPHSHVVLLLGIEGKCSR
ncbi:uncharacterized protein BO97DRAFT_195685 [Aspergillus homomorphus CBS 101889]|uniref:Uncharacterized protein n=1 Tax=Aspergillus homomorphus (strain CBS 101889) TaxID=1450537 RepID=A0A395HLR6_ASPHC|nr:hypothetical protein BO97DRAFT_195685 [Aspergillus homomorphus CBS 101889]RAL08797.1 hypothetical protein BO97DRAFT_195685 [Aspergillus homomorphus CBS 101889]